MKKREGIFLISILIFSILISGGVYAQDEGAIGDAGEETAPLTEAEPLTDYHKDYYTRYGEYKPEDLEFNVNPGITPDNAFYPVDNFVEGVFVGNNPEAALNYKEEKIAEAIAMVDKGMPEEAGIVLEKALEYNDIIEREVTPELEERVQESSMQVQTVLLELEEKVAEEGWDEVTQQVNNNFEQETKIRTAAEIAAKIKELCIELAALDPIQYEDTCKVTDNSPNWMKDNHKKWTQEQEKEAREFGAIMEECVRTSGRTCRCEDISFYDFSIFCEKASSLSVKCSEGDDVACKEFNEVTTTEMPELPDYLQDVFDEVSQKPTRAQYEKELPQECIAAGATNLEKCMLIMIELHAPSECRVSLREAVERGEIVNERTAKKICGSVIFEQDTPQQCKDAGITSPEECAEFMMPQECKDAGINGAYGSDEIKCKELMMRGRYYGGSACSMIRDPIERNTCFEGAVNIIDEIYYRPKEAPAQGVMTWQCKENRIHWPPDCEKFMRDAWPEMERQREQEVQRNVLERKDYVDYTKVKTGVLCPDGICDEWEQRSGGCYADCGQIPRLPYEKTCDSGCYWDYYYQSCQCPPKVVCGPGCWPEAGGCKCSVPTGQDRNCGPGCWWEDYAQSCKCSGCTCPDGRWSENCQCAPKTGCWCGNYWSDTCNCGPVAPAGCQCSWGWSPDCNCAGGGTQCSPGCWWEVDHCNCGERTACASGCWWDDYYKSCQCSVSTCPTNAYTLSGGNCNYATCPSGCRYGYNGCPEMCMIEGGCTCPDGYYSTTCDCSAHQSTAGCQCSCGWSATCSCVSMCPTTSVPCTNWAAVGQGCNLLTGTCCSSGYCGNPSGPGSCVGSAGYCGDYSCNNGETISTCPSDCGQVTTTCASKGGTCCTACSSSGPYISGTECNCCGACATTITCASNSFTLSGGGCNYATCPNGCNMIGGCPTGCMSSAGYCGDNVCSSSETMTSCPSDCGTTTTDPCPSDACPNVCCGTTTGGTCSSMGGTCCSVCSGGSYISGTECNCCGTCETTTGGCTSTSCGAGYYCGASGTCMPSSTGTPSGCTCADGYYSSDCNCAGHESLPPPSGCTCADGYYSTSCDCSGHESPPVTGGVFWDYYYK